MSAAAKKMSTAGTHGTPMAAKHRPQQSLQQQRVTTGTLLAARSPGMLTTAKMFAIAGTQATATLQQPNPSGGLK
jgi:hypothetical protein